MNMNTMKYRKYVALVVLLLPGVAFAQTGYPAGSGSGKSSDRAAAVPVAYVETGNAEQKPRMQEVNPPAEVSSAFQESILVHAPQIVVPTVIEVPIVDQFFEYSNSFAVWQWGTSNMLPSYLHVQSSELPIPISAMTGGGLGEGMMLLDGRHETYVDYALPEAGRGVAVITLTGSAPITSSRFTALLDNNVALPTSIEIRTLDNGVSKIIVAKSSMYGQTTSFLKTTARVWQITLEFAQPLRITDVSLYEDNGARTTKRGLRFLAQPGATYVVYMNPDRYVNIHTSEAPNLYDDKGVLLVQQIQALRNVSYMEADSDGDGIPDRRDNCVSVANLDQADIDGNGRGDVCDDFDRDGIINSKDNCPNDVNYAQTDADKDGIGDVCDGKESRFTEAHKWVPWAGMSAAGLVLLLLFFLMLKGGLKPVDAPQER